MLYSSFPPRRSASTILYYTILYYTILLTSVLSRLICIMYYVFCICCWPKEQVERSLGVLANDAQYRGVNSFCSREGAPPTVLGECLPDELRTEPFRVLYWGRVEVSMSPPS